MQRKSPSSGEVACEPSDNIIRQDTKEISRHAYSPIRQKETKVKASGTTGSRGQARWQASRYSLAPDPKNYSPLQVVNYAAWGTQPTIEGRNKALLDLITYLGQHHVSRGQYTIEARDPYKRTTEPNEVELILHFTVQNTSKNAQRLRTKASRLGISLHDRKGSPQ